MAIRVLLGRRGWRRLASAALIAGLVLPAASHALAADCNANGIEDSLDLEGGASADCNANAVPDECEFALPGLALGGESFRLPGVPRHAIAADVDGDGDADLLTAPRVGMALLRSRGDGTFDEAVVVPTEDAPLHLAAADLDGDGDLDLATANDSYVELLENRGGAFAPVQRLPFSGFARHVAAVDLTGDGKPDLALVDGSRGAVFLLEGLGPSTFGEPRLLANLGTAGALTAADLDGDADVDLLIAKRGTGVLFVLENDGAGGFGDPDTIVTGAGGVLAVVVGDLNGDAAADVAAAAATGVAVLINAGGGVFRDPVLYDGYPSSLVTGDLDGDGDLDIAFAHYQTIALSVLFNVGNGSFLAAGTISSGQVRRDLTAGDFDGDGDLDLGLTGLGSVAASIAWNGEDLRAGLAFQTQSTSVGVRPHGIGMGDLDGDGFLDVITSNGHFRSLTVLLGTGDGSLALSREIVVNGAGHFNDVDAADLDGDGDEDLVAADQDDGSLRVFPNLGGGRIGASVRFRTDVRPWVLTEADFDRDGDLDVAVANVGAGTVNVHLNDGQGGLQARLFYRVGSFPMAVAAGDVDGDGAVDLAAASAGSATVAILLNDGQGSFRPLRSFPAQAANGLAFGDFDGDRDLDIATAGGRSVGVSLNTGDGSFPPPSALPVPFPPSTVIATELDGDGKLDLVTSNQEAHSIGLFLGRGDGTFRPQDQIAAGQQPTAIVAGDIDRDGDIDLATSNRGSLDVTVALNQGLRPAFPEDYLGVICTGLDFFKMSVPARDEIVERVCKYIVPAAADPTLLPPVFQNTARYPLHQQFLAAVFPDRFPGLTTEEYDRLVARRATRRYFAGSIGSFRLPAAAGAHPGGGLAHGFSIAAGEVPGLEEARSAWQTLRAAFRLEPLGYRPDTTLAREAAAAWRDPGFPVYLDGGPPAARYHAYTRGVAYGRVRLLDEADFAAANATGQLSFQNILVLGFAPRDIEGVVGGVITGELQGELSHLSVRTARRRTPNAFVAEALAAFAPFDGKLIRLEVAGGGYEVREASEAEAVAFWAANRPRLSSLPTLDVEFRELATLEEIAAMDLAEAGQTQESRFGGKATNLARLGRVLAAGPHERYRASGFAVPVRYYFEFLRANTMPSAFDPGRVVTYEEHLRELLAAAEFQSNPAFRFQTLARFRDHAREHATVDRQLVGRVAGRILNVFQTLRPEVRCRSSSNVEDLLEFNGAGLYESTSACAADDLDADERGPSLCDRAEDDEQGIARALVRVWTSLWTFRAHEERSYFGIPPEAAGMAVLVSRAFGEEAANGVAFTGNIANPLDRRYVVTAQLGEESVVSPDPGVLPEKDVLEIRDGSVARILRPERGSSLVPPGAWILSEDQLRELGGVMAYLDREFPVDPGPYDRRQILLDMEFKLDRAGELALKQIRPFLITEPLPPAPTFELVIPAGTAACGVFAEAGTGRGPREEYELKSIVHLKEGAFSLPTGAESFAADLVEGVTFGPARIAGTPGGSGIVRVARFPGAGGVTSYRFRYEQDFILDGGRSLALELVFPAELRAREETPIDARWVLDSAALVHFTGEEILIGRLDGEPVIHYGACDQELFPGWEVEAELEDGTRLSLEERFRPPDNPAKTGPASLAWGDVAFAGGERRFATEYWDLVYSAFRHNTAIRYWVVFDVPAAVPGVDTLVRALELAGPNELEGAPAAASYLGPGFEVLGRRAVVSFRRLPASGQGPSRFRRGDSDADGAFNLADGVATLNYLFLNGPAPACVKSADADDTGVVNLTDGLLLLNYLFHNGPPPAEPFAACGLDATPDALPCSRHLPCR